MPEPAGIARSAGEVCPGIHRYTMHDDRIDYQSDSYVIVGNARVTLLDPLPMQDQELSRHGSIEAIVLTASCHERSAWRYRTILKVPVYAPEGGVDFEEAPDRWYKAGDLLPGGLRAVHAPGPTDAHYAFYSPLHGGVVFCADLLMNAGGEGLDFVPGEYQDDPARTRDSVRKLLDLDLEILCTNHGDPVMPSAKQAISKALERDKAKRHK